MKLVRIYHRGRLVKVHPRQPRGGRSTDTADYPRRAERLHAAGARRYQAQRRRAGPGGGRVRRSPLRWPLPWARIRQGHKLLRLGQRYTPRVLTLPAAGPWRWTIIDVGRVERILVQALEQQETPEQPPPLPTGRFARPGSVFVHAKGERHRPTRTENRRSVMTRVPELTPLLKRLQLGPMAATLPKRIALARRDQLDYASFLEIILSDEVNRRADRRLELRLRNAGFEETCRLEDFDWSAAITLDPQAPGRRLLLGVPLQARARPAGGARRCWQDLPGPGPGLRPPSGAVTPSASATPTTSSGPWPKPGSTTPSTVPSGPSCPRIC